VRATAILEVDGERYVLQGDVRYSLPLIGRDEINRIHDGVHVDLSKAEVQCICLEVDTQRVRDMMDAVFKRAVMESAPPVLARERSKCAQWKQERNPYGRRR
jgi:hypothetical protein